MRMHKAHHKHDLEQLKHMQKHACDTNCTEEALLVWINDFVIKVQTLLPWGARVVEAPSPAVQPAQHTWFTQMYEPNF